MRLLVVEDAKKLAAGAHRLDMFGGWLADDDPLGVEVFGAARE